MIFMPSLRRTRTKLCLAAMGLLFIVFRICTWSSSHTVIQNQKLDMLYPKDLHSDQTNNQSMYTTGTTSTTPAPRTIFQPDCQALLRGDAMAVKTTKEMIFKESRKKLSDQHFIFATQNCSQFRSSNGYKQQPDSLAELKYPIAYILTVHTNAEQVERLLRAIYAPQNIYCIHIDKKAEDNFQDAIRYIATCFQNVFIASKLENVIYGGFSRLKADINCMRDLLNVNHRWKYAINVAGQDFPLKTNGEIVSHLKSLDGLNDIPGVIPKEFHLIDRFSFIHNITTKNGVQKMKQTSLHKSPPPHNVTIYFGNAYYLASRKFVQFVMTNQIAKDLLVWMKDTYSPDENFWVTLQRLPGTPGGSTIASWSSAARAIKWSYFAGMQYPACQGHYVRDVCVYSVGDLNWLINQIHLFANKFDINYDHVTLQCLEQRLTPKIGQIKPNPLNHNKYSTLTL